MTLTVDAAIPDNAIRLDFAIGRIDVWYLELGVAHRAVANRDILRGLLAQKFECDLASLTFRDDGWGKPHLAGLPNVHVNASRSGSHFVAAIGPQPVGVDVEMVRPLPDRMALATLHLTPSEYRRMAADQEGRRDERFLMGWTRKEACAKAIGAGLRVPPCSIATGVEGAVGGVDIAFGGKRHVVEVESTVLAGCIVVSAAVLLSTISAACDG
jgi:4'-phosphopantetheinyl transferase